MQSIDFVALVVAALSAEGSGETFLMKQKLSWYYHLEVRKVKSKTLTNNAEVRG
jgi:hypothetical protein